MCIQSFGGEMWRKRPPRKHRHRWENTIKIDFQEMGEAFTGFIWLRIWTDGGLSWIR
jgi:hypothetical protein